mgnify:CR=1 FL=1
MSYALVTDGILTAVRNPGRTETKLSDGRPLSPPDTGWSDELAALCGFVPIVEVTRPADTSTKTTDRTVTLVAGVPTVVWVQRDKSADELASDVQGTSRTDLLTKARAAVTANQTFLALATPTNAQVVAQVQRLTRECSALLRLAVGADLLAPNTDT